jgi:hypothetical protein
VVGGDQRGGGTTFGFGTHFGTVLDW